MFYTDLDEIKKHIRMDMPKTKRNINVKILILLLYLYPWVHSS